MLLSYFLVYIFKFAISLPLIVYAASHFVLNFILQSVLLVLNLINFCFSSIENYISIKSKGLRTNYKSSGENGFIFFTNIPYYFVRFCHAAFIIGALLPTHTVLKSFAFLARRVNLPNAKTLVGYIRSQIGKYKPGMYFPDFLTKKDIEQILSFIADNIERYTYINKEEAEKSIHDIISGNVDASYEEKLGYDEKLGYEEKLGFVNGSSFWLFNQFAEADFWATKTFSHVNDSFKVKKYAKIKNITHMASNYIRRHTHKLSKLIFVFKDFVTLIISNILGIVISLISWFQIFTFSLISLFLGKNVSDFLIYLPKNILAATFINLGFIFGNEIFFTVLQSHNASILYLSFTAIEYALIRTLDTVFEIISIPFRLFEQAFKTLWQFFNDEDFNYRECEDSLNSYDFKKSSDQDYNETKNPINKDNFIDEIEARDIAMKID